MNYFDCTQSPKLLVIDDDRTYQQQLTAILRTVGINDVTLASSAEEGIACIYSSQRADCPFDLMLLDINMPKQDGIETCLLLTEGLLVEDTPIMMVTGTENIKRLEDAISVGAVECIQKPFSKTILLARIDLILENQKLKKQIKEYRMTSKRELVA